MGAHTAQYFWENKAKVICIAEYNGYIYNEDGLHIPNLRQFFENTGSILNFPAATTVVWLRDWVLACSCDKEGPSQVALEMECDILIPAAMEQQINKSNASKV